MMQRTRLLTKPAGRALLLAAFGLLAIGALAPQSAFSSTDNDYDNDSEYEAQSKPQQRAPGRACDTMSDNRWALIPVAGSTDPYPVTTSQWGHTVGTAVTRPTLTLTTGTRKCGSKPNGGSYVTDTNFPTASTYKLQRAMFIGKGMFEPVSPAYFKDSLPGNNVKLQTVEKLGNPPDAGNNANEGPCEADITREDGTRTTAYFFKVCADEDGV
jgi:long-subunit fatty acid transport protein